MSSIGLIGILTLLGLMVTAISTGSVALWVQRRFFLH